MNLQSDNTDDLHIAMYSCRLWRADENYLSLQVNKNLVQGMELIK